MSDYRKYKTTGEVYHAIKKAHPELLVYGSFSAPDGAYGSDLAQMHTSWSLPGSDVPIIECHTSWDVSQDEPFKRENEEHRFYLCVGKDDQ